MSQAAAQPEEGANPIQLAVDKALFYQRRAQTLIDSTVPYTLQRWGTTGGLLFVFMLRIVLAQGWYIGASTANWSATHSLSTY